MNRYDYLNLFYRLLSRKPAKAVPAPTPESAPQSKEVGKVYQLPVNFPDKAKVLIPLSPRMQMLRRLKWVTFRGRVGIIANVTEGGDVIVDLVNSEGITVESVTAPQGQDVQIARWAEIPEPRRPADPAYAATLGYF